MLYGARTGGDGIGGVSVLASETFDADGPAKRPAVQVGDPFMEKLLIEAATELMPPLLESYPAVIWEDQDECLEVRPEDVVL